MGCDAHCFVEYDQRADSINSNEKFKGWIEGIRMPSSRNYLFFTIIARVRGNIEEGMEPKGFPEKTSYEVKDEEEKWGIDWHSKTHLTLEELDYALTCYEAYDEMGEISEEYIFIRKMMKMYQDAGHAVRLIVAFDN